ncbi:MAG: protein kinase domain-containing protein [Syntrophorhabdaceae bacterium]
MDLAGYIVQEISEDREFRIFRATRAIDSKPVILKLLRQEYPSNEELSRFRQEFETIRSLSHVEGVVQTYCMEDYEKSLIMVLEDFGGTSLASYISHNKLALKEFLSIAIRICSCLRGIHDAGIIHRDINPSNIIYNPDTNQLKIIDFGLSITEGAKLQTPYKIEGNLPYIAPEHTGRISRAVDWRMDFYSLGITLYEMITGRLPFDSTDSLELVHAHIARKPIAPHELDNEIPEVISSIIMKLISKDAEDRYQSAIGIKADLEECLERLKENKKIGRFPIGSKDVTERFMLPAQIYGRKPEIEMLVSLLQGVTTGLKKMVLVSGAPGIGKTCLIRHFKDHVTYNNGRIVSAKFDQYVKTIPYSAITGAYRELIRQLLSEPNESLAAWRETILSALSPNCQVIIDLIPELEFITGNQPPVPVLGAAESQNRLKIVFYKFISLFCKKEHPLVVFLDDVQWADLPSIGLIETMMTVEGALMLICAYRDTEVGPSHPFLGMQGRIPQEFVSRIYLEPLKSNHVMDIISNIVHCERSSIERLALLVHEKTGGNPFFVGEFLKTLNSESLLIFDIRDYRWHWDLNQIKSKGFTDNVLDIIVGNIGKLSPETQLLLKRASMLGNVCNLEELSILCDRSPENTIESLKEAVQEGFVTPLTDKSFTFPHDRIQQGAYAMIPAENRSAEHLRAGRLLLGGLSRDKQEERLFMILDQYNKGKELITASQEKLEVAKLNFKAGVKAKKSAAFFPAYNLFKAGIELLGQESWHDEYDLTLSLHIDAAETAYLSGDADEMERLGTTILKNSRTLLDVLPFHNIRIQAVAGQGRFVEALDIALSILDELGLHFPRQPSKRDVQQYLRNVQSVLKGRTPEEIATFPDLKDPHLLWTLLLLAITLAVAYISSYNGFLIMTFKCVQLLCEKRVSYFFSRPILTLYGTFLAESGKVEEGFSYIRAAELLAVRPDTKALDARVGFTLGFLGLHWKEHLRTSFDYLIQAYYNGLEYGNIEYTAYSVLVLLRNMFMAGVELSKIERDFEIYTPTLSRLKLERSYVACLLIYQGIMNLRGLSDNPCIISGTSYRENEKIPIHIKNRDITTLFTLHFMKMFICYLLNHGKEAVKNSLIAEEYLDSVKGSAALGSYYFYDSLIILAVTDKQSEEERRAIFERVSENQKKLKKWSQHAPMNFSHKYLLVEAERARIKGKKTAAMDYYDQAIKLAGENKYLHEEAISNELAGLFYLSINKKRIASVYLSDARYLYQRWGATAKIDDMEKKYGWLIDKPAESAGRTKDSGSGGEETIDVNSIIKASQIISGEIVYGKLLSKLMDVVVENAGAQRGFLFLDGKDEPTIAARSSVEHNRSDQFCSSIVNYVQRTKDAVVLSDTTQSRFSEDPYIKDHKPRSLLCMPIMHQTSLTGILYLENNLATGAFTPDRVMTLSMLASQAAISIQNARFYENLTNEIAERKEAQERYLNIFLNAEEGIFHTTPEGKFLLANPALVRIFGYSSEEEAIENVTDIIHVYANQEKRDEFLNLLNSFGSVSGFEFTGIRKDKSTIELSMNAHLVKDEDGKVLCIEGMVMDITSKKQTEKMKIDKEVAEAASRAKGDFLARMSHEIRTPMNAIIGFADLVSKTSLDLKQSGFIHKIQLSAKLLLQIINDILDFSKIEAGKLNLESIVFRPSEVINNVTNLVLVQAAQKAIEVRSFLSGDIPPVVKGDPLRLTQVLGNLLNNAIKFTQTGYVCLKAELLEKRQNTCTIRFLVEDTGIGMTEKQMKIVFDPFSQAEDSITRNFGGTGLGLTISRHIVEIMGSKMSIKSEPGRGSIFSFDLQFSYSPHYDIAAPAGKTDLKTLQGARILLAEDNAINQEMALEILKAVGVIADVAHDGNEAVMKASLNAYDLILMDVEMPVMGGYEATRQIRTRDQKLPIIAMTAHALEGARQECLNAGMNDYIAKPLETETFYAKLSQWLKTSMATLDTPHQTYFPLLPGINVQEGLERSLGDKDFYRKLLISFFTNYASEADRIKDAVAANDLKQAAFIAHTIKGTSANLSIEVISHAARQLETAIRAQTGEYTMLISQLDTAMKDGVKAMEVFKSSPSDPPQ